MDINITLRDYEKFQSMDYDFYVYTWNHEIMTKNMENVIHAIQFYIKRSADETNTLAELNHLCNEIEKAKNKILAEVKRQEEEERLKEQNNG